MRSRRSNRSRWRPGLRSALAATVGLAVAASLVVVNPPTLLGSAEDDAEPAPRSTAGATVQDLSRAFEVDGEIRFVSTRAVTDSRQGTIGWVSEPERSVTAGDVLYIRDDQPVVLLAGDVAAWRSMAVGDEGDDVAQLEANLLALGYGDEADFTVDGVYTTATADVVRRWQADLGVAETGEVALGDVVFGPEPARVGSVSGAVGQPVDSIDGPLVTLSSSERELAFTVAADTIGAIEPGTTVTAGLPDRSTVPATVAEVVPLGGGSWQVTARIDGEPDSGFPTGDAVPATVSWTRIEAEQAVTVPAGAVLRLDDGRYAVEVVTADGEELRTVEVGARYGPSLQIVSGLEPSDVVIAP